MTKRAAPVQHGLRRTETGKVQTLWIEGGPSCNLCCGYCFASSGEPEPHPEWLMTWDHFDTLITEAANLGVDSIGIPGAGEPFHPRNRVTTMRILRKCADNGIFVTLFTTGEYLLRLPNLVTELLQLPVELMIKCNTLDPDKQDRFVSNEKLGRRIHGFGIRRNQALDMLMAAGFNKSSDPIAQQHGRESRMALVTSIMSETDGNGLSNVEDMPKLLEHCRTYNLIFDCDSVLERGRGATCTLKMRGEAVKAVLLQLQAIDRIKFERSWELSQSYVDTVCDRYMHHMYVTKYGDIHPCIGSVQVVLGNIRKGDSLASAWERKEMRTIRSRNYIGACATCAKFVRRECNSCLGRWTENLTNEYLFQHGHVMTCQCWNYEEI